MLTQNLVLSVCAALISALPASPKQLSGIYPSLAMFNTQGECGTGAVVPWADSLWIITYAPHSPNGSDDMLYQVTEDLVQTIRAESIGGTPANRMIHPESGRLFIGPYAIDQSGDVRTIPYSEMSGRHTGNARHLFDPENKIYYATMEEGIYEVDVKTLKPTELFADDQKQIGRSSTPVAETDRRLAKLPGYHGKGLYSGQGYLIYANNGEPTAAAKKTPEIPSGVLAEWDGKAEQWNVVRRNQFTEVTGPGGILGNPNPATDPIWAVGWDHRSLLLGVRTPTASQTPWTFYRLPKGSHSYDGAHGWNTEWPRIREIGENALLMTMHGTFWKFPKGFTPQNSSGISPRSNYLKVIGDFCRWNDRIVLGCDDTAKNEFLNTRKAKGHIAAPQSQSNLWFIEPDQLDQLGPVVGRGMVWSQEPVPAGACSDPYLFQGYDHRILHLSHQGETDAEISIEIDPNGDGQWRNLRKVKIPARGYAPLIFSEQEQGIWVRLRSTDALEAATAAFSYRNRDTRSPEADLMFAGIAKNERTLTGGVVRARGGGKKTLSLAAIDHQGEDIGYYELNAALELTPVEDASAWSFTKEKASIAKGIIQLDEASVLYIDDEGKRWRLPKGDAALDAPPLGDYRAAREVATERDLFNAHGTFYELPARNAGGFIKVRPIATHNRYIHDYCSYRGLFIVSGISTAAPDDNPHIIKSSDGKAAIWAGAVDDLWKLGKPRGNGGPWMKTKVKAQQASEPYLMTAYDKKSLALEATKPANITVQIDISGSGQWVDYKTFSIQASPIHYDFPDPFSAYWIRFVSDKDSTVTAQLDYR